MLFEKFAIVDLTHSLSPHVPTWDNSCGFNLKSGPGDDQIIMATSTGTHMDAPSHLSKQQVTIDTIPLTQLFVHACIIDVSDRVHADYAISVEDIQQYEKSFGPIENNSIVIGYTGWSNKWNSAKSYRNVDEHEEMHFPVFSLAAVEYLLLKGIAGIGTDCFSPEPIRMSNPSYPIHALLFKEKKYIIENIAHADQLPAKGAYIIALPLKIQHAGEAPCRVIALIPKKENQNRSLSQ